MNSIASLLDESPSPTDDGESRHSENNAAIPGEDPGGFDGEQGESQGIAELLSEDGNAENPGSESKKGPARLLDQAEKLGLKPEDLYALTISFDDGKSMSVGQLKDIGKKATDFEAANLELEARRQEQEVNFTRMHGELRELVGALPKAVVSERAFLDAARKYESRIAAAKAKADSAIESWSDPAVKKAEQEEIGKYLTDYGFEAGYLDKILDPRTLKLVRDASRLSARVKAAMSQLKKGKPDRKPGNSGSSGTARKSSGSGTETKATVSKQYSVLLD